MVTKGGVSFKKSGRITESSTRCSQGSWKNHIRFSNGHLCPPNEGRFLVLITGSNTAHCLISSLTFAPNKYLLSTEVLAI